MNTNKLDLTKNKRRQKEKVYIDGLFSLCA